MIGAGVDGDTLELTPDSETGIRAQLANTTPNCGVVHAWLYKICPLDMEVEPAETRRIVRLRRNWFCIFAEQAACRGKTNAETREFEFAGWKLTLAGPAGDGESRLKWPSASSFDPVARLCWRDFTIMIAPFMSKFM